jgi:hypothetical protein
LKPIKLNRVTPPLLASDEKKAQWSEKDYTKSGIEIFKPGSTAVTIPFGVPVLDQGAYGTCVTFAATAAANNALNIDDFISQQCTLELLWGLGDNYWDGANYPSQILDPLKKYGLVEKGSCDNQYATPYASLSTSAYQALVAKSAAELNYKYYAKVTVEKVKESIRRGHVVAIGFMLKNDQGDYVSVQGFDTKVGGVPTKGGLWACKQPGSWKNYCGSSNAGHEVVITGFDDKQELFKIRNSWNTTVGDQGDFYMTYKFFTAQAIDGTEIW